MRWTLVVLTLLVSSAAATNKGRKKHKPGSDLSVLTSVLLPIECLIWMDVNKYLNKNNEENNIKFCGLVEQHRVLYDHTMSDYHNRNVSDRAWAKIAQILKTTGRALLDRLSSTTLGLVPGSRQQPPPLDVAPYSTVVANASCGQDGAEEYCRDTPAKRLVCDICEGSDGSSSRQHPASHAVDGDHRTWWQSPSMAAGDYQRVAIVASLPDRMELLHVIIKSGPSPRPLAWSLDVSSSADDDDWVMVRAFGDKEHCRKLWGLQPERRRRKARETYRRTKSKDLNKVLHARAVRESIKDRGLTLDRKVKDRKMRSSKTEKPKCSTQFASPRPLENGEMHVGLGDGVACRRVRISFHAHHPAPDIRRYYTVRVLTLAARCLCHGHASHCPLTHKGAKCECLHGTCGTHCQRCCSGARWSPNIPCDISELPDNSDVISEIPDELEVTPDVLEAVPDVQEAPDVRQAIPVEPEAIPDDVFTEMVPDVTNSLNEECFCGDRGACLHDDTGSYCVNCTENRAGPLCDRCLLGYYNAIPDGPCLPCNCHPDGSDGTCTFDRKLHAVTCTCNRDYSGPLCDACSDPAALFPGCQTPRCKCDPRGVVDPDRVCEDVCECKVNVVGESCDACASGYFALSADNPRGCLQCYCSHVADHCVVAPSSADPAQDLHNDMMLPLSGWLVATADGNATLEPSMDNQGNLYLSSYEVEGWKSFYWSTESLSGGQLGLFGSELGASLRWGVVRGDTGGNPSTRPDLVLVARDGTKLWSPNRTHTAPGDLEISVPVLEGHWFRVSDDGQRLEAERGEILDVLRDLQAIMIRGHFHGDQDEVRLQSVTIRWLNPTLEQCSCPPGYTGNHCERCSWGHSRASHGACAPCACNGHADCSFVDGACGPCQHNTTGPHCERCLPGHYGNPVQGSCKPCACPLYFAPNNFSPNCALAAAQGDDYVCTQCPQGYVGDHCEICEPGYWGNPTIEGGSCEPCSCGGAGCSRDTGRCLTCPPHAEGATCDQCKEGFYLHDEDCIPCECGAGALAAACDTRTGVCECKSGWAGDKCDTCALGYGDITSNCPPCACSVASLDPVCDVTTGACECAVGAAPPHCLNCLDGFYGLDEHGCLGCNCSSMGAESNVCDIRTGQCRCRPHFTGRACDTCEEGYWAPLGEPCRHCECGAGAAACDPRTGLCACARGVTGDHCDTCMQGFYGFGSQGCLPCPRCSEGRICSPETGRCVCPPHAHGPRCQHCTAGYWLRGGGCRRCQCGPGAQTGTCDPLTGKCQCRIGWTGDECDTCAPGYFGSRCRPCHCHQPGTKDCVDGTCVCDQDGRCPCKENVVGTKCDQCLEGTFGLSDKNPTGCTACFCFGRSTHCTQASLTRAALHAASPTHLTLLMSESVTSMDQDSLLAIHTHSPDITISLPWPPVPVYMELDKRFLGDRVTSYGGALKFKVEEEGGVELSEETRARFPLVRLYGRNIVLDYHERVPPINGTHIVRFHESLWSVRTRRPPGALASRSALMLALQQLDRILLRVTTKAPTRDERVHALLLNVSLDTAIPGLSRSEPALGVELCECPRGYAAESCHQPALGFWIPQQKIHMTNVAGTILITLEGGAQECKCNGRATQCDPHTGDCLNCTHGTGGQRCDSCAPGYHGAPNAPMGCQPCPCPDRANNFAKACHLTNDGVQCLCKPGYTGLQCESCSSDHYRTADICAPCSCDPRGSLGPTCDRYGACKCRPFAVGDKCDQCKDIRSFLDEDGCKACDNCTQTLLDSIEALTDNLHRRSDLNELSRIPKPFPTLLEYAHNTTFTRLAFEDLLNDLENSRNNQIPSLQQLNATVNKLLSKVNRINSEARSRENQALSLSLESMSGLEEVLKQRGMIVQQVTVLDDFAKGERHLTAHKALKEARHLLREIKDIKLFDYITGAEDVADAANLQSTSIQEHEYRVKSTNQRLNRLKTALDQWEARADDLPRLADIVWTASDNVASLVVRVRPRLAAVKDVGLRCRLLLEDITNLSPTNLTEDAYSEILRGHSLTLPLPSFLVELETLIMAAEKKEGILYNITPQYKKKYLEAVERHVEELGKKAREYKSLFAGTRSVASAGVTAAHAWSEVASTVKSAAETATQAASIAAQAAQMTRGQEPMTHTAQHTMKASEELKRRGAEVLAKAEELRIQLDQLRRGADLVSVLLRGLGWQERDLGARPQADVEGILRAANEQADRVFANTRVLYDEASEIRRRVRYNLRRQLAELQKHGDTALGAVQEHVSQIRGNIVRGAELASALASAAAARHREHTSASETISPQIQALRDKVARARHAADSISVSLSSPAMFGCSRAYSVQPAAGAVTRAAIAVSFDGAVQDGTLLYLADDTQQESESYMKLFIENKHLHLSWQLGGGGGSLTHPQELMSAHDDGDHTSYRIQVERVWTAVHLTVERAGSAAITVSNSSTGTTGGVSLRATTLWLGGTDRPAIDEFPGDTGSEYFTPAAEYLTPGSSPPAGLPGCVHALYWDDSAIGLWNFHKQPKEAKCTGCTQRWYNYARSGDPLAWFNGAGYASLRRSTSRPSDRRQFSLALTVRTTDENALLFMANDEANNRSVQVLMRDCRIVFVVTYTGSRLEISARGRHCLGRPAHVQAIRVFAGNKLERGSLRVNGEETLGSPTPPIQSAASLPDLSSATYWVGGAPPGASAPAPPLLGCLGALTVDREGYDLLETPTRHGVESRCGARTLRSATFEGSGYIELPSPTIRRKAAIGLSFRARSDGVLLLRAPSQQGNDVDDEHDGDDRHYIALAIDKGELVLSAAAGKQELRLHTNNSKVTDGALHAVRIVRAHKQLELWLDDELAASGPLLGNAYPARSAGLFLGGTRDWDVSRKPALNGTGFSGTIADFIVDSNLIGLETALQWQGVSLGRADSEPLVARQSDPPALQAKGDTESPCVKQTTSFTVEAGAVKFGDVPGSHATLRLAPRSKELVMVVQLRTFATDGLIALVPGPKSKPKHYIALLLREGKLKLIARGRRRKEVSLNAFVADGTWRSVSIRVSRSRLVLSSGGAAATAHAALPARAARLHVGGLPASAVAALPNAITRSSGFVGCIRRVSVNGRAEDLVGDVRAHHGVGQCFPSVEQGAYFGGDAHAVVFSRWAASADGWQARLALRAAAPGGMLLAAERVRLELHDHKVVLRRLSPTGEEVSRTESLGSSASALCDNNWHVVSVRVSRTTLALSLDQGPELKAVMTGIRDNVDDDAIVTALYLGGIPEGVSESEGRENFKGCIKDVSVAGRKVEFTAMDSLHNVLLDSCPVAA